jgi:hypothetical protein
MFLDFFFQNIHHVGLEVLINITMQPAASLFRVEGTGV